MSTADKLLYLQGTKSAIKDAIVAKGVDIPTGTTFREYADKIGDITTGVTTPPTADDWVRPTEWLALPDNVDGVQKVSILNAVFDTDSEIVTIKFNLNTSFYSIDWGDGVTTSIASGIAEHKYDYNNVNLNSDTVIKFGYKQCIITITPNNNATDFIDLASFNCASTLMETSTGYDYMTGFLDIRINLPYCTSLNIGYDQSIADIQRHVILEQCIIGELAATDLSYLFNRCQSLQSVSIRDTSNVTNFRGMHSYNYLLSKMPYYTFNSSGVNCKEMFTSCYNLYETYPIHIKLVDESSASGMFSYCKLLTGLDLTIESNINYSLENIFNGCISVRVYNLTLIGNGKVINLNRSFSANTMLKKTPAIDTSLCTIFTNCFSSCTSLVDLYEYDYSSAINLGYMLSDNQVLKKAGHFNTTSALTNIVSMLTGCISLLEAPTFSNTNSITNASGIFNYCYSLKTVPIYSFPAITANGVSIFFSNCTSLISIPSIILGVGLTSNSNVLSSCYSLKRMLMPLKFTFSVANAKMSATALNEMYSILPTVTGQTVTVTGNYGVSDDDPTIATAKGWTVAG